jgi:hypothetical protein
LAVYAVAGGVSGLEGIAALGGVVAIVFALVAAWDGGLVAGPALLLVAYALSVADGGEALDRAAPLVGVGLVGVVEFGSWSLELRDGAEEQPLVRLPAVFLLLGAALAASTLVLAVGGVRPDAGLMLWVLGAGAAIGLLALIALPAEK